MPDLSWSDRGVFDHATGQWRQQHVPARRTVDGEGLSTGWLLAGLAAVALGAWAAYHFGPDLRRYIKMERM